MKGDLGYLEFFLQADIYLLKNLSEAVNLNEARNLINNLPHISDTHMWKILLDACQRYGNTTECLIDLEPHNTRTYAMLSNMYAGTGRRNDVA